MDTPAAPVRELDLQYLVTLIFARLNKWLERAAVSLHLVFAL